MAVHRTSICLNDAGHSALQRIPRYERSQVISNLLLARDPSAVDSLNLKVRLAMLDDKLEWTSSLLSIAREIEVLEEEEKTLNSPRAERLYALALKACLLKQEFPCKATRQTLFRVMRLYSDLTGKKLEVKDVETKLNQLFKSAMAPKRK